MIGHITRCTTSRDLWYTLEALYQSQSKARVMQLKLQLQTLKKGDSSIDDYFLKMRNIADCLAVVGKPVADEDLILHILAGFGSEFDAVVVNLTNRSESLSFQEVQFALQSYEIRLQNQQPSFTPAANLAQSVHHNGGRGYVDQTYGRGRSNDNSGRGGFAARGRGGRGLSRDTNVICQLCGKNGHLALKCFKRFDVHFTGVSAPQAYYTDLSYDPAQEEAYYAQQQGDQHWYADSGATAHVTNDLSNLQLNSPYNGTESLHVGNGYSNQQDADEGNTGQGAVPT